MPTPKETAPETQALFQCLNDALPQTQCTRCGFPDCASYALAMAEDGLAQVALGDVDVLAALDVLDAAPVDGALDRLADLLLVAAQEAEAAWLTRLREEDEFMLMAA